MKDDACFVLMNKPGRRECVDGCVTLLKSAALACLLACVCAPEVPCPCSLAHVPNLCPMTLSLLGDRLLRLASNVAKM